MSLSTRLARIEASLLDAVYEHELGLIARRSGAPLSEVKQEAEWLARKYDRFAVELSNGMYDIEPVLRAAAEGEGFDLDELMKDARRMIRKLRRLPGGAR